MSVGVDLFFAISGYVIALNVKKIETLGTNLSITSDFIFNFYRRRFVRLWPASALWLSINVIISIFIYKYHGPFPSIEQTISKAFMGFVYLYNFNEWKNPGPLGYFWSLSIEWQFYMIFPLFILLCKSIILRISILIISLIISVVFQPGGELWGLFRFDGFIFGYIAYLIIDNINISIPEYKCMEKIFFRILFIMIALISIIIIPKNVPNVRIGYLISSVVCSFIVSAAALNRGYIVPLCGKRIVGWLGSRSYSLYLCHLPIILVYITFMRKIEIKFHIDYKYENIMYYILTMIFALIAAEITYRFVELPSHKDSRKV
jgi:peptidoglycan/LPS O-acetylase OafA/YrhL